MKKKIYIVSIVTSLFLISMIPGIASVTLNDEEVERIKSYPYAPEKPTITGPCEAELWEECEYQIKSEDPQGDQIYYKIICSDCPTISLSDYCYSGETMVYTHCWDNFYQTTNPFIIRAQAIDYYGYESEWGILEIEIDLKNAKHVNSLFFDFIQQHPLLHLLFHQIINK